MPWATSEATAKFVPPPQSVAPSGKDRPGGRPGLGLRLELGLRLRCSRLALLSWGQRGCWGQGQRVWWGWRAK